MGIKSEVWMKQATQGQIASVALDASIALRRASVIFEAIASKLNIDVSEDLEKLKKAALDLHDSFDSLSGYEP